MTCLEAKVKYIISGTNRPQSRSYQVSKIIQSLFKEMKEDVEIIDLAAFSYQGLGDGVYGTPEKLAPEWQQLLSKIKTAEGILFVVPEYNGSMPGALKYFIDQWSYPDSFEGRPVAFIGLGGMFGGLRPVEHLQQVMAYRNAYQFPERVFLLNIFKILQNGEIQDPITMGLLRNLTGNFKKFCQALKDYGLDANSKMAAKKQSS